MKNVYLVIYDGATGIYETEVYLEGVYTNRKEAEKNAEIAKTEVKRYYSVKIIEVQLDRSYGTFNDGDLRLASYYE